MNDFTAIFDMDGVILDSERVYQEIERNMYDEFGIPVSHDEHMEYMGTAESWMWATVCRKHKINMDPGDLIAEERKRFIARLTGPGSIQFMEGLIPLLDSLKAEGIPCWIGSSSAREIIRAMLEVKDLGQYFMGYVGGDEVFQAKPSPEIYLKAAELAGSDPARCIVIEDSPNGVRSAVSAGMTVIALVHQADGSHTLPETDLVIDSLSSLNPAKMAKLLSKKTM